jgi:hypothetical protein
VAAAEGEEFSELGCGLGHKSSPAAGSKGIEGGSGESAPDPPAEHFLGVTGRSGAGPRGSGPWSSHARSTSGRASLLAVHEQVSVCRRCVRPQNFAE